MIMAYFRELLHTLKNIEKHLSEISACVNDVPESHSGKFSKKCVRIYEHIKTY